MAAENETDWQRAILSVLKGCDDSIKVKKLRKQVLLSLQQDDGTKAAKKQFKEAVQTMEKDGTLQLDSDGMIKLIEVRKKRKSKDVTQKAKKHRIADEGDDPTSSATQHKKPTNTKNSVSKDNPQGITRLFLGNLPFAVDEATLEAFLPGLTHIKWITDKETGKFYGSAFCEMDTSKTAAAAVRKTGSQLMNRPVKINYAPARPGDQWPPSEKITKGGSSSTRPAGGSGMRSVKPDQCCKLFLGNLSYEIDDDSLMKFFGNVDAEVKAIRWIHHKETGDFKGVYVL